MSKIYLILITFIFSFYSPCYSFLDIKVANNGPKAESKPQEYFEKSIGICQTHCNRWTCATQEWFDRCTHQCSTPYLSDCIKAGVKQGHNFYLPELRNKIFPELKESSGLRNNNVTESDIVPISTTEAQEIPETEEDPTLPEESIPDVPASPLPAETPPVVHKKPHSGITLPNPFKTKK
jgi:hypothetical protein